MKIRFRAACAAVFFFFSIPIIPSAFARWVWSPEAGKFVNTEGETSDTAEELYEYALQFYRDKDLDEAVDQLQSIVKKYPDSRVAPDAQYRIGTVYEEKADFLKAFEAYQALLESYPQNRHFDEVVERLYRIGNLFLSGEKGKVWGLEILPSLPRAVEVFKFIVKQAPFSAYGDQAQFQLGVAYKKWGHYEESVEAFQTLIDQYPKSGLLADARYQLAETSFQRSSDEQRDQRALDEASREVNRFLSRHPDVLASEQAQKIRQMIDEKNAEKNYRIGLYYEKENYLESALIYYTDAAKRYPGTQWGAKALEKIRSLAEPADYHNKKERELRQEIQVLEAKLKVVDAADKTEQERLQRKLSILREREESLEKQKKDTLTRRKEDIERREGELKQKIKNLEKKKKAMKSNISQDFQNAVARWEASLVAEQEALQREKEQLAAWRDDLGIRDKSFDLSALPFVEESKTGLDRVRSIEAKRLFKLSEERRALLEEKELLYKHRSEVTSLLEKMTGQSEKSEAWEDEWLEQIGTQDEETEAQRARLKVLRGKIKGLEKQYDSERERFEKEFGESSWEALYKTPTRLVTQSTGAVVRSLDKSFELLNPFGGDGKELADKDLQELLERQMHLKEKIASQRSLTETLSEAFNAQLALQEQQRLLKKLDPSVKEDPRQLRKSVKALEKKIRAAYQEIEALDKEKEKLLEELEDLFKQRAAENKPLALAKAPIVKSARMVKAFFVGLPNRGVELTNAAKKLPAGAEARDRAMELRSEIELKSLLIEAKSREMVKLNKQLEILKAKASLAGGFKFRSVLVEVPYAFLGEAIDNAKKVVPRKQRDEILIDRLNEETKKLEAMNEELKKLNEFIQQKERAQPAVKPSAAEAPPSQAAPPAPAPASVPPLKTAPKDVNILKRQMEELAEEIQRAKGQYARQEELLRSKLGLMKSVPLLARLVPKGGRKEEKAQIEGIREQSESQQKEASKLHKELAAIEESLHEIIEKESSLERRETSILEKRISEIDRMIPKVGSQAVSQNLLTERERMASRLTQLELRRDFLIKEMERFQLNA